MKKNTNKKTNEMSEETFTKTIELFKAQMLEDFSGYEGDKQVHKGAKHLATSMGLYLDFCQMSVQAPAYNKVLTLQFLLPNKYVKQTTINFG